MAPLAANRAAGVKEVGAAVMAVSAEGLARGAAEGLAWGAAGG